MAKRDLVDLNIQNYPSNSKTKKIEETMPERRTKTIVEGGVKYKTSLTKKFQSAFFGDENIDVKSYIFDEIIIPGFKGILADICYGISDTVEMALFGRVSGKNQRNPIGQKSRISYDSFSRDNRRRPVERHSDHYNDDTDIILSSKREGENIINALVDLIDEYGMARVADLNIMLNRTGDFNDNDWGWTALGSAKVKPVRGGYLLDIPRPISLKRLGE